MISLLTRLRRWGAHALDLVRQSLGRLARLAGRFVGRRGPRAGFGAVPVPTGAGFAFLAWAPAARGVEVAGDFAAGANGHWHTGAHPLSPAGDGYWGGVVPSARAGQRYKFVITAPDGRALWRMDPAARDTDHSGLDVGNAGILVDPAFAWTPFRRPDRAEYLIYQLHVGTFTGRHDGAAGSVGTFGSLAARLSYIGDLGFTAIELMPVQEFTGDRSWGYNPSFYFAPESAYGSPHDLRTLIDAAHAHGLAVLFDVVYNHVSNTDNPLWEFDGDARDGGAFLQRFRTPWSDYAPAYWKPQVRDFFLDNARVLLREYNADGLRFDATRYIEYAAGLGNDGWGFLQHLTWHLRREFPGRYLVAEHLPDHESIVTGAGFDATWIAEAHHEFERAATQPAGPAEWARLRATLGRDLGPGRAYPHAWNLVRAPLGSHDDCGDDKGGATIDAPEDWQRHRYLVEHAGGRHDARARAIARLGWALAVTCPGTPMLFMGAECHHPGYWHDGHDANSDHRFDWSLVDDGIGREMRRFVAGANRLRRDRASLRSDTFTLTHDDPNGRVLAFKRWLSGGHDVVLAVANLGDGDYSSSGYGVHTGGQAGRWVEVLNSQAAEYGGWATLVNAGRRLETGPDGRVHLSLPAWSVVVLALE
jgi:1,4-alpha-glucan branching enzyme